MTQISDILILGGSVLVSPSKDGDFVGRFTGVEAGSAAARLLVGEAADGGFGFFFDGNFIFGVSGPPDFGKTSLYGLLKFFE